jgi:NADH-quinone oxidoreductase subunit G
MYRTGGRGDMTAAPPPVQVTIDGTTVDARPGELLIKVAQDHGVYIPRFCWHERMKPVGMCRMCLVEVDGIRGLPPACTIPVTDGMVCRTETDVVKAAQDGVLELLLINHPLDCPVCDRGGECPLQDTTLAFGPGESRFVEEKRHFEKPIPISDLVLLDRERCIQCARCTRFADEIAGDPLISFVDRGDETQVLNFPDDPFASYFSGNVVQICPVGALTATPYRFRARPWDLATVETSCTTCAVQCRGALQSSSNRLVRLLGVDSDAVNHGWLCDKGRFGYEHVHSDARVLTPRLDGAEVSWPEALDAVAAELERVRELHGAGAIAVLGGARGTNESAYTWARLVKGVLRTDNCDAQLGDGLPAGVVLGVPRAELGDLDGARAIVLCAGDLKDDLPVLFLRVKRAAVDLGVPLIDLSAAPHGLTPYVTHAVGAGPGEQGYVAQRLAAAVRGEGAHDAPIASAAAAINARGGDVVVVLGRPSLAERPEPTVDAAGHLAGLPGARFLSALRRGNVHGALDAGLAPGLLPGRVDLDDARDHFDGAWGATPVARGLDAEGILRACSEGKVHVLVLLGADPIADFPDVALARHALDTVSTVVAVDAFASESNARARAFLPCTLWGEQVGTVTNVEGRVQRLGRRISPDGTVLDDWRIAAELALRLGDDFDLETVDEVTDELAQVAPAYAGISSRLVRAARDGVLAPIARHHEPIVMRRGGLSIERTDSFSWEPIKIDDAPPDEQGITDDAELDQVQADALDALDALDAPASGAARGPALVEWAPVGAAAPVPARDGYALRVIVRRALYDGGRLVTESPSLRGLRAAPELRVAPADAHRLGVADGERVKVTSGRGSITVPVRAAKGVTPGVAELHFSADGTGAAELVDASVTVTDLRVETLR